MANSHLKMVNKLKVMLRKIKPKNFMSLRFNENYRLKSFTCKKTESIKQEI